MPTKPPFVDSGKQWVIVSCRGAQMLKQAHLPLRRWPGIPARAWGLPVPVERAYSQAASSIVHSLGPLGSFRANFFMGGSPLAWLDNGPKLRLASHCIAVLRAGIAQTPCWSVTARHPGGFPGGRVGCSTHHLPVDLGTASPARGCFSCWHASLPACLLLWWN